MRYANPDASRHLHPVPWKCSPARQVQRSSVINVMLAIPAGILIAVYLNDEPEDHWSFTAQHLPLLISLLGAK